MSYIFIDNTGQPFTDKDIKLRAKGPAVEPLAVLGAIVGFGVYVFMWWIFNAMFGNATPSLWDFIWQGSILLAVLSFFGVIPS